jgi:adhesin HecA-like repeat protein
VTISSGTPNGNPVIAAGDSITCSTMTINAGVIVTVSGTLTKSGNLSGDGNLTVSGTGTLIYNSGTMSGNGTMTIQSGGELILQNSSVGVQRDLVNQGAVTQSGNGAVFIGAGGTITNSGTWELQSTQGISGFNQVMTNNGTIRRTTSVAEATIGCNLNGSGNVIVESGTLNLTGGGNNSGDFDFTGNTLRFSGAPTWALTGNFTGPSGGRLFLDSGTLNFNAGATLTNVALLEMAGSTANFNTGGAIVPADIIFSSGEIGGTSNLQLAAGGNLNWTGGEMSGTGTTTIGAGRTVQIGGSSVTLSRPFVNQGTVTQTSSGAVTMTAGGATTNAGTWDLQSAGGISGFSQTFTNTGTLKRTTSAGEANIFTNFNNSGAVNAESGTLAFSGSFTQVDGGVHLAGGNVRFTNTAQIQGGVVDGNGEINGSVSVSGSGQFSPGTSPGQISITNNRDYTQAAPAKLVVDIDGTAPATGYDVLAVSDAATLGGELQVRIGYTPDVGDSFTILTHKSRTGTFGTLNFESPGPGLGWDLSYSATETKLTIAEMLAASLGVDAHAGTGTSSDVNGLLEPGERVVIEPGWQNVSDSDIPFTGTASLFQGPAGETYTLSDNSASYGTASANSTTDCFVATANCYQVQLSDTTTRPDARPAVHWDATVRETVSGGQQKTWTLHVGDSFPDVPRSHLFYRRIETLLHTGITAGCTTTTYCPEDTVNRGQMAIFVARALAGGSANVPVSGEVAGQQYNCIAGASGASIFTDVLPTDIFCRHVHYIAAQNVTLGCTTTTYCPAGTISRIEMAAFIAKAVVAPGGGPAVPASYTDPVTGFNYNCGFSFGIHFTDVPNTNVFCKHVHYLWAKGIVTGTGPTTYGPNQPVTRGAMARFLSNAFNLLLYGPTP